MRKEIRQLRRDRITVFMIVGLPMGQIILFGYAINTDVRDLVSAVANQANTHLSRQFVAEMSETQIVDFRYFVETADELEQLLRSGKASIGVLIPPDFDRRAVDPSRPAAHLLVDGADPTIVGIANQLAMMPVGSMIVWIASISQSMTPVHSPSTDCWARNGATHTTLAIRTKSRKNSPILLS